MASTSTRSEAHPSPTSETQTTDDSTKTKCMFSIPSLLANFCGSKSKTQENNSTSATPNKNGSSGEDRSLPSAMIPDQEALRASVRHMDTALKNYTAHMQKQIDMAREKLELQNSGSSKRDLEELTRAIDKLKLQIPTPVNILPTADEDERHGGADLSPRSKLIHDDLTLVDSTFLEAKEYMDQVIVEINRAHENFKKLPPETTGPERVSDVSADFDELRKTVKKLKVQIPSYTKFRPRNASSRHPYKWPYINGPDSTTRDFFYKEATAATPVASTCDSKSLLKAFQKLPVPMFRICLLCFFKFPPEAVIKRTTMIYLWIGLGYTDLLHGMDTKEVYANRIFDLLVERGFIQPIYRNSSLVPGSCSLVPGSCRMSPPVRSALYEVAEYHGFTSHDDIPLLNGGHFSGYLLGHSCLINVGEAEISSNFSKPETLVKNEDNKRVDVHKIRVDVDKIRVLHYGRWQTQQEVADAKSLATHQELGNAKSRPTHHIELTDAQILHDLKIMKELRFLSLGGISMISELPPSMSELPNLEILDLRACHNLEGIPDNINLLQRLTHLDMSECYFLEHMPESLAQLSNLEVLKGFIVGVSKKDKRSCTPSMLSGLRKLKKLNIYITVKDIDTALSGFDDIKKLEVLEKLTISWGGCTLGVGSRRQSEAKASTDQRSRAPWTLPPRLHKLDLQCFPSNGLIGWLLPAGVKELKKLYIRGGHLCDLDLSMEDQGEQWNVEILRLNYLSELKIDWSKMEKLFPRLVYLHQVECPQLSNFPCDERGVWMKENVTHV